MTAFGTARGGGRGPPRERVPVRSFARDLAFAALERAGGNKTHAAKLLGIARRRYSLLASFGATPAEGF